GFPGWRDAPYRRGSRAQRSRALRATSLEFRVVREAAPKSVRPAHRRRRSMRSRIRRERARWRRAQKRLGLPRSCDPQQLVEESDRVFPGEVIESESKWQERQRQGWRHERDTNEACQPEPSRNEQQGQKGAMQSYRPPARMKPEIDDVPSTPRVWNHG